MTIFKNLILVSSLLFSYAWGAYNDAANRALRESFLRENDDTFCFNLKNGANPNTVVDTTTGQTAFQYAILKSQNNPDYRKALEYVLDSHGSGDVHSYIEKQDLNGNNGLHYAAMDDDRTLYDSLKEKNSAASLVCNGSGQSPDDLLNMEE